MMGKIGLLTFHDTTNFGSWLQTYALYKKVKQLGYHIEIIDYKCEGIKKREKLTCSKLDNMLVEDIIFLLKKQIAFYFYTKKYLRISKKRYSRNNLEELKGKYTTYLLGSDLVWDLNITYGDTTYLFDFLPLCYTRYAYAASDGRDYIPDSQRSKFKEYLQYFKTITVRENGMVNDIKELTGRTVEHVCDPTLLLECDEWKRFIKKKKAKQKYVLLYFVDEKGNLSRIAKKYAREHGLKILAINKDFNIELKDKIDPISISDFLSLIFYAEKVFTASYHGMMFSLIFNKQLVFFPFAPATRMRSVSEMFELDKANIDSPQFQLNADIDYDMVNEKLNDFRKHSIKILEDMLRE